MTIKMKTSLEHLPERKQAELSRITEIISSSFPEELEMLILFGSHARGDWQEELYPDGVTYQYQSDYDIYAITRHKPERAANKWHGVEKAVCRAVKTPVTLLRDSMGFFNDRLSHGYFFYVDVVKEGVLLYDSGRESLAAPRKLTVEEAKAKAQAHYDEWFVSAEGALDGHEFFMSKNNLRWAAFILHQATEHFLASLLLSLTDYKPRTHDLKDLIKMAAAMEPETLTVFPKETELERLRFERLRKAYTGARYDPGYIITREDLEWLLPRVKILGALAKKIFQKTMDSFSAADGVSKAALSRL
jgi:HEPN domain-containing protein/predicted nucleotidyltransferase